MNKTDLVRALNGILETEKISDLDLSNLNGEKDFLSEIYEKSLDKTQRKKFAQFFTHKELVTFIIKNIPMERDSFVLDPACGAGAFLIEAYNTGHNFDNIYGVDIDSTVLDLAALNLEHACGKKSNNLTHANTLKDCNLSLFPKVLTNGGFDVIIGNPPFQNLKKNIDYFEDESIYGDVLSGIANSAALMIAKGYELLKEGGYLGFVLPKNIVRVDSFLSLRKFLINNTRITHIFDLDHYFKDVRCDQIIIIFQKMKMSKEELSNNKIEILIHKKKGDFDKPYKYYMSQDKFLDYKFFPIFYHESIFPLAQKFLDYKETVESTSDDIFRGLGVSSSETQKQRTEKSFVVYRGDCIQRFGIKYELYLPMDNLKDNQLTRLDRLNRDKIILQNLCSKEGGIFATLAKKDELTLDTVTNITSSTVDNRYLLAVLNSRITNFFMIFVTFLNSNFTMHTDREYIGKIPIVVPELDKQKAVIKIVNNLLSLEDKYSAQFFLEYEELNTLLYDIYKLSESERNIINNLLKEVMSGRQNGRKNE
ncbi:TPA: N-6 DNA methylase [Candidatus Woesearchaeota archaeon]|nr:N-6 DNA methylase [Candidatus Woesearchaeota archaeon]HIH31298.1 N-6 DNA methylase [Candidatus Woesearchaeota archaeon]HIH55411.1 N-6 DNA methylase [Candidatus Woesearchaeota archaeon]HIJ01603.1 N-6 DNA methylase [Candidatus Woesearchaeota archaeon]HIJ14602.1 N-6 DNA methylase [Candidatus Woesearchaeota archaeon]